MEITRNHILKRTKKQVGINLEDAVENKKIVDWKNMDERELSEKIHSMIAFTNVKIKEKQENSVDDVSSALANNIIGRGLLPLLLRARQSCIYPKMVGNEAVKGTSKLDSVVAAILERKDNNNGKIVFCHFKEELNEIAQRLRNEGLQVGVLDGKTSKGVRAKILTEKKDVLIMQIQTGCEGLNLQDNYSEIYFVSPHWNPYIEDQAIARCHRIGQVKPVFVWRFEMNNFDDYANANANCANANVKNLEKYVTDIQNGKRDMVGKII
jgi:SNF2 family DNA or RNA helicase